MAVKEKYKHIEISGRKWVIGKMDALTGCFVLATIMAKALPLGLEQQLDLPAGVLPQNRSFMTKEEFIDLQKECLKCCFEYLPAGKSPVIATNGAWGVMDIEDDMVLVISLTIHALIHNISGFFVGNAFKDLLASFKGMKLAGVSI